MNYYPDLEVKSATMSYTAFHGHKFSFYARDLLHLRLSRSDKTPSSKNIKLIYPYSIEL
ncbi:MAG: hypothetical protein KA109_06270 [Saprospiraceae bacterium]|nr:hypothetical protein [Saprospiraceae bacterium]MBK6477991.1 hypothetical protein [Saprospiraceae bacterium]MBK7373222.1 hypothetical protein [Saprospiraceae bacterium]MBK7373898.1 hypothetical protein [Saprospiraceae bacterium]MBK7436884.1 hypothetical protein [Saprospiraceae bacterium]